MSSRVVQFECRFSAVAPRRGAARDRGAMQGGIDEATMALPKSPEPSMCRRSFLAAAASAAALALMPFAASAQEAAKKTRVVVQVSDADPARWNLVLNNVRNLQDDLGAGNVVIEVVAYGPGIGMLKLDAVSNSRVTDAIKAGVQVSACENTMRN